MKWNKLPTQIASTCVEVDYAISLWDVHSPHVPKQIFRGHIDAVPDIIWLPPESEDKESHLLACSRDESIGLHGLKKHMIHQKMQQEMELVFHQSMILQW